MELWRRLLGHDGYVVARLRISTAEEGGRERVVQSGYRAQWWLVDASGETWIGDGPIDLVGDRRSIKPAEEGVVHLHPMAPADWRGVRIGAVLHMRERPGLTLGVASVEEIVDLPDDAPLRLHEVPRRPGTVLLTAGERLSVPARARRWLRYVIRRRLGR